MGYLLWVALTALAIFATIGVMVKRERKKEIGKKD